MNIRFPCNFKDSSIKCFNLSFCFQYKKKTIYQRWKTFCLTNYLQFSEITNNNLEDQLILQVAKLIADTGMFSTKKEVQKSH